VTQRRRRLAPPLIRALQLLALVALGFVVYQVVFVRAPLWAVLGRPRPVGREELGRVTGVVLPAGTEVIRSRYRKGTRTSALFAELSVQKIDVKWLEEKAVPGVKLVFSASHAGDLVLVSDDAPEWWPEPEEVSSAASVVRRSGASQLSHRVVLAMARRGGGGPGERLYLYWARSE
jgi:hypothetical protein